MTHRRRPSRRWPALLGLTVLVALGLGVPAGAASGPTTTTPSTGPTTTTTTPAEGKAAATAAANASATYDQLAHCVSTSERLFVVLLVDESGSLQQTDPKAVRVAAAKTALAGLVGLTDPSSGGATVDVQVSAFSNTFKPIGTFAPLTRQTLPTLQGTLDQLKSRDTGMDTDYTSALAGAREALAQQAVATGDSSGEACKAILLFTDGFYDLGVRTTAAQRKEFGDSKFYAPGLLLSDQATVTKIANLGIKALCDRGGVADQLRADQVTTLAVALTSNMRPSDQAFLQAVVSGKGPKKTCGTRNGSRSGVFLPAFNPASLIGTFDTVATRIAGGSPAGPPVSLQPCVATECATGRTSFVVDNSLRRIHLFVTVPDAQTRIELTPPNGGSPVVLQDRVAGSTVVGGTTVASAWPLPTAATIDLTLADNATGSWQLTLVDPARAAAGSMQLYTFSDLTPQLLKIVPIQAGVQAALQAQVVSLKDKAPVTNLRSASMTAVITDPITGRVVDAPLVAKGKQFVLDYTPPGNLTTSVLHLVLRLTAVTHDGVNLTVSSDPTDLATSRPKGFPVLSPVEFRPSSVSGKESASTSLEAFNPHGAKPGCVWVSDAVVTSSPAGVSPLGLTVGGAGVTQATCLRVAPTGASTLSIKLKPRIRASGTVTGSIRVWTEAATGPPTPTDVPFSFEMTRGIDKTKQLALFLVLLAAGIGLPLAFLFVMNVVSTRFQVLEFVVGANLPVVVYKSGTVVRTNQDGERDDFRLYGYDFRNIPPSDSKKHFNFAGLRFAARPPANPLGAGYAVAVPEAGAADVARQGRKVNLALSLAGSWIFLYDPDATNAASRKILGNAATTDPPEVHGRLVAFIAQGPVPPQAERLVLDIFERLPRTARALTALSKESEQSARRRATAKPAKPGKSEKASKPDEAPAPNVAAPQAEPESAETAPVEPEAPIEPESAIEESATEAAPTEAPAEPEAAAPEPADPEAEPPPS